MKDNAPKTKLAQPVYRPSSIATVEQRLTKKELMSHSYGELLRDERNENHDKRAWYRMMVMGARPRGPHYVRAVLLLLQRSARPPTSCLLEPGPGSG